MAGPGGIEPPTPGLKAMRNLRFPQPSLKVDFDIINEFYDFCFVDERLSKTVSSEYRRIARKFLEHSEGLVSRETIRDYLSLYLSKAPKTYNNQLDGLRAFVSRFLRRPDLMDGFKKAYETVEYERKLPSRDQIKRGFYGLEDDRQRALYMFYATSGLRKREVLGLNMYSDVDFEIRCVMPKHDTRTKRAGVSFYNEECEKYLERYLDSRRDDSHKLFRISKLNFNRIWDLASQEAGFRITPQVLRVWFATEMGELGVPDRYVDIFQGRAPRTVLAKYYTGKGLDRLKRIYDKAGLRVLS